MVSVKPQNEFSKTWESIKSFNKWTKNKEINILTLIILNKNENENVNVNANVNVNENKIH